MHERTKLQCTCRNLYAIAHLPSLCLFLNSVEPNVLLTRSMFLCNCCHGFQVWLWSGSVGYCFFVENLNPWEITRGVLFASSCPALPPKSRSTLPGKAMTCRIGGCQGPEFNVFVHHRKQVTSPSSRPLSPSYNQTACAEDIFRDRTRTGTRNISLNIELSQEMYTQKHYHCNTNGARTETFVGWTRRSSSTGICHCCGRS